MIDETLAKLLEQTGFTPKEAGVYLALLELNQGTVKEISKITGLKRSIIYVILEELIKRGYASEIPGKKINAYQAIGPSVILAQLRAVAKNFSEMLPFLETLHHKGKKRPKIRYIESKEGIWKIYEEINYAQTAFFITSYSRIEKHFPGAIEFWLKGYKKGLYKLKSRTLISDDPKEIEIGKEFKKNKLEIRSSPVLKNINMDFTVYGNNLAITSLGEEPFLVLIESEELVNSVKPIFELVWKSGKPI